MADLSFVLAGKDAARAADTLSAAFDGGDQAAIRHVTPDALSDGARKSVDLIALATLILSVPPGALAVWDIADRIRKRRKAQAVIDAAQKLRVEQQVEVFVLAHDSTPRLVVDLDADKLLDLVAELDTAPESDGGDTAIT